jgi:hypothetical protein
MDTNNTLNSMIGCVKDTVFATDTLFVSHSASSRDCFDYFIAIAPFLVVILTFIIQWKLKKR